ncbi:MAG: hypothetical protein R3A78_13830 [Polyangiales bacterium]
MNRARPRRLSEAIGALAAALDAGSGGSFLLEGVTGSGKTEVYLQLIARARAAGKGALLLVPVALTRSSLTDSARGLVTPSQCCTAGSPTGSARTRGARSAPATSSSRSGLARHSLLRDRPLGGRGG